MTPILVTWALAAGTMTSCQSAAPDQHSQLAPPPASQQTSNNPAPTQDEPQTDPNSLQNQAPAQPQPQSDKQDHHANNPRRLFQLDDLERIQLTIGEHKFKTWVMDTNEKRMEGMMFLKNEDFKDTDSMTFSFTEPQPLSFWMRNTLVDLDIAYVDKNFFIIRAVTMKALDETGVPSNGDAQYAIEFRGGIFKKLGIKSGQKVKFAKTPTAKD